jgi:predicted Zn finger-like uncharacterized protein
MALIRCPNCDTLHDLDGALFAGGPRKVKCATCRTVWEATDTTGTSGFGAMNIGLPKLDANRDWPEQRRATSSKATTDSDAPPPADGDAGADISPEDLEALFAEPSGANGEAAPEPAPAQSPDEHPEFDPESLARAQDAENAAPSGDDEIEAARARRRAKRLRVTDAHHKPPPKRSLARPVAAMLMAAGIGTLTTLVVLRHETARLVPETAALFEAFGLGVSTRGLDIRDVQGRLVAEESRETLEITGTIANPTKAPLKIPVLRLSIRNSAGHDIYVWTATADQPELAPGEATSFRRRLASPPPESHAVMVRFVAKDDIVAAIR